MPVYDQTYRHFDRLKHAGNAPFLPIAETGVRLFFRNKRYILLAIAACIPFFGFFLLLLAPHIILSGQGQPMLERASDLLTFSASSAYMFLQLQGLFVFLFAVLVGGGLVANDLRTNALEIYFSKPLDRWQYFLGKLMVVCAVMLMFTLAPCLVLWLTDLIMNKGDGHVTRLLALLPRVVVACLVLTVPYGLLALACSSVARSARLAMAVFAGFVIMSGSISTVLSQLFATPWFELVSLSSSMRRLAFEALQPDEAILSMSGNLFQPLLGIPAVAPLCVVGLAALLCVVVFFKRVRGVEVVGE